MVLALYDYLIVDKTISRMFWNVSIAPENKCKVFKTQLHRILLIFVDSNSWNIINQLPSFKTEIKCTTGRWDQHGLDGMFK